MNVEDRVLVDLHRAAALSGRPGIAVPSIDLQESIRRVGRPGAKSAFSRLGHAGRVVAIRRDLALLPDSTGLIHLGVPDLVGVVAPTLHLITGGRALEASSLTDQHFFTTVVLTARPTRELSFRGERAVFLPTTPGRIWGWQEGGPHYATAERAIVDVINHPRYGVPLALALSALCQAVERDSGFLAHLTDAVRRYNSPAAAQRIGLLIERLFGENAAAPFRELIGVRRLPVPLRPNGSDSGDIDRKWKVLVNATTEPERKP